MNTQASAINNELRINYRFERDLGAFAIRTGDRIITTAPTYLHCDETAADLLCTLSDIRTKLNAMLNGIHHNVETGNLDALYQGNVVASGDHTDYTRLLCALSDARIRDLRHKAFQSPERILPDYAMLETAYKNNELAELLSPYSDPDLKTIAQNYTRERKKRDGVAVPVMDVFRQFKRFAQRAA